MSNRDGSKAYYLLGNDVVVVEKDEQQTEGKVLGAFILAATEYEKLYQDNTVLLESEPLEVADTDALVSGRYESAA